MLGINAMPTAIVATALQVIAEGRSYATAATVEGDGESGPYALRRWGFRLGRLCVELHENGSVDLNANGAERDPWGNPVAYWWPVPADPRVVKALQQVRSRWYADQTRRAAEVWTR